MNSVGIYYRVSTDRQDLASQENAVERWINDLPADRCPKRTRVYKDEGISGKTTQRPGFQKLLDDAYAGKIDTIIVYRLDRFSRHATTAIRLLLNLDEAGVAFISVTQAVLNLGHENPFRRTMLAAFAEIAEIERETIVARVKAGLDAAKRRGVQLGAPVKVTDEKRDRAITMKVEEGRSLRYIAKELSLSLGSVAKIFQQETRLQGQLNKDEPQSDETTSYTE